MIYVFDPAGMCLERSDADPPSPLASFQTNYGTGVKLVSLDADPYPQAPLEHLRLAGEQVILDPDWQPPEPSQPTSDDTAQRLASLEAVVAANLLASPHDRRWLAQKEAAKGVMTWMQANPACDQAQVEAQVLAAMQAATPGEPVVVAAAGLVQSYADEAARRGLVPAASFEGLKALVLASSPEQLRQMLAVL